MKPAIADNSQTLCLFLTREAWESSLRPLLLEPGQFATGSVRWRREPLIEEALCSRLDVTRELPTGASRPPLEDWLVLIVDHGEGTTARQWTDRLAPRDSQRLVVLVLNRDDRSRWEAVVSDRGRLSPVDGVVVVGSGMLAFGRGLWHQQPRCEQAIARTSRTAGALGEHVFGKVRSSCVTLVGAGRLGCLIAFHLAGLGVRQLRLIDPDVLGLENLDAMPGLTERDVGRPKVEALAKRLLAFRSDLLVSCLQKSATDPEAIRLVRRRTDLLVTCVDSDTARLCTSLIARETLTVHLDVATHIPAEQGEGSPMHADVRLLVPDRDGGCIGCVGGLADPEETVYELAAPPGT